MNVIIIIYWFISLFFVCFSFGILEAPFALYQIFTIVWAGLFLIPLLKTDAKATNRNYYPEKVAKALSLLYFEVSAAFACFFEIILGIVTISSFESSSCILFGKIIYIALFSAIVCCFFIFCCRSAKDGAIYKKMQKVDGSDDLNAIVQAWILSEKTTERNREFLQICAALIIKYHEEEYTTSLLGTFRTNTTKDCISFLLEYLIKRNTIIKKESVFSQTVSVDADKLYKLAYIFTAFLTAEILNIKGFQPPFENYWYWHSDSNTAASTCENCIKYLENIGILPESDNIEESVDHLLELYSLDFSDLLHHI